MNPARIRDFLIDHVATWALLATWCGFSAALFGGASWWWFGGPLSVFLAAATVWGLWEAWR